MIDDIAELYDDPRDPSPKDLPDEVLKRLVRSATMVAIAAGNRRDTRNGVSVANPEYKDLTLEMATAGLDMMLLQAGMVGVFDAESAYELGDELLRRHNENVAENTDDVGGEILSKD